SVGGVTGTTAGRGGRGGGIYNAGTATVIQSTISGNHGGFGGNGITGPYGNGPWPADPNTAGAGGNGGPGGEGGGIYSANNLTVDYVTLALNQSLSGTTSTLGLYLATATIRSSIVSDGVGGSLCSAPVTSGGFNIDSGSSCGFTATGDHASTSPQLGPLAAN